MDDGNRNIIKVVRNVKIVKVKINGKEYFRKKIYENGKIDLNVLYIGGMNKVESKIRKVEKI
jgi:hypothetical protein